MKGVNTTMPKTYEELKQDVIRLRLEKDIKEDFVKLCKTYGTTPSDTLRRYIVMCLRENKI